MFFLEFQSDCCRQSDFLSAPEDKNYSSFFICEGVLLTLVIKKAVMPSGVWITVEMTQDN